MKKDRDMVIPKELLLQALDNTYDESHFLVGYGVEDDCDFTKGLCRNRSVKLHKTELLNEITHNIMDELITIPGHPDTLVLNKRMCLYKSCVNENQIFQTAPSDGYYHAICKYNPNYDVFIKLDHEKKNISFLLGSKEKTLELVEYSEFVSKPSRNKMLCVSANDLERHIHDEFWNPRMINVGRRVLRIKPAI